MKILEAKNKMEKQTKEERKQKVREEYYKIRELAREEYDKKIAEIEEEEE